MNFVPKPRIRGLEGCRCRNFDRDEKLLELVLEAVRDANGGMGANPQQLYQYIRQYHRVPIKDDALIKIVHSWLAKSVGYGFVRKIPGGKFRFVTKSRRQARASRMQSSSQRALTVSQPKSRLSKKTDAVFTRVAAVRPSLVRPSMLGRLSRPSNFPLVSKLNFRLSRPMRLSPLLKRPVKFVKESREKKEKGNRSTRPLKSPPPPMPPPLLPRMKTAKAGGLAGQLGQVGAGGPGRVSGEVKGKKEKSVEKIKSEEKKKRDGS